MSSLPQTGAISLNEISAEFGVSSGARSLKAFYRGGDNVSATDLITSSATSAPSNDTPVQNFAGVTGLTLTRTSTTNSTDTGYVTRRSFNANTSGGPVNFLISANEINSFTSVDWRLRRTGGINDNTVRALISRSQNVAQDTLTAMNTSGTSHAFTNITQVGSYRYSSGYGDGGTFVEEDRRYGTETVLSYSFVNNSPYAVTVVGATTQTIQVGETLTGVSPDSNSQYTCSYTPISSIQTANPSPPTSDSAVSDFGSVTGLTCTRTSTTTSTTVWTPSSTGQNSGVFGTNGGSITFGTSSATFAAIGGRSREGSSIGYSISWGNGGSGSGNFFSGGVLSAQTSIYQTGPYTLSSSGNADYVYRFSTVNTNTTLTYSFTNNTGFPIVISGSGVTTTTIPDGGTNNSAIDHPSGNFTIQYEVANAQAKNGNIPTGGAISLTDFYGTEDFS